MHLLATTGLSWEFITAGRACHEAGAVNPAANPARPTGRMSKAFF